MRQLTCEILNGAIFAALVVLASEMQRQVPLPRLAEPSQPAIDGGPASRSDVRTQSFAAFPLARSALVSAPKPDASALAAVPAAGELGSAPASGQAARDTSDAGTAVASPLWIAPPAERVSAGPAASKIDAFVRPIRRQRPSTPPLTFSEPASAKAAKGSERKVPNTPKAQVKRAARKGQEPARSALGAASPGKVASEAAAASKSKP